MSRRKANSQRQHIYFTRRIARSAQSRICILRRLLERDGIRLFLRATSSVILLFLAAGLWSTGSQTSAQTVASKTGEPEPTAQFVGSASCSQCHKEEHTGWLGSQHAAAMQKATDETVLGRFDGATFSKDGVESTFFKKDGKFWVRTDGLDGKPADFEISYTFGIAPLQQYLIELPGGRVQALGIAWDARPAADGGQRWYHLYPDRKLVAGDPLHWTGIDQNWNYQCAWCHSTNVKKNYDLGSASFQTKWSEISVGCEACHGPASRHIAWAAKSKDLQDGTQPGRGFAMSLDERQTMTWKMGGSGQAARSMPRSTAKEIQVCASCHARRQQFSDDAQDVAQFFDAFRPSLIDPGLYHVDGQQRDEVYNYGSFLQSKMHAAGVTCSDCHNPHSGKLRTSGNAVCAQCHAPARFDQISHHHHAPDSKGALCASCHMPTTTYMGVDARHDHSMRIPRPDRTNILAVPNACNQCHTHKSATWAAEAVKGWFPVSNPGAQNFAEAFDLADRSAPGAQSGLLRMAGDASGSAIARASALSRLGRYPSTAVLELAAQSLKFDVPEIRNAAISVIAGADAATRRSLLVPLLNDKTRLVRMDAARALAGAPEEGLPPEDRDRMEKALAEYIAAQLFNSERPESHANLGALYNERGKTGDARAAYEKAIAIDPTFFPAAIALSEISRAESNEAAAEAVLQKALAANPTSAPLVHALALSLIRQKRTDEALANLADATKLGPDDPRFAYVYAVALHDTGKPAQAIEVLKNAVARHPYDRDTLMALTSYEVESRDLRSALSRAELLKELEPDSREIQELLEAVKKLVK